MAEKAGETAAGMDHLVRMDVLAQFHADVDLFTFFLPLFQVKPFRFLKKFPAECQGFFCIAERHHPFQHLDIAPRILLLFNPGEYFGDTER